MKRFNILFVILLALSAPLAYAQALVFPHFASGQIGDGTRWSTELDVVNLTASGQSVKISFFKQDGSPRIVFLPGLGGPPSGILACGPCMFSLGPNSMLNIETDGSGEATPGWALVEATGLLKGSLIFRRRDSSNKTIAEAGVLPQPSVNSVDFIPVLLPVDQFNFGNSNTGFALANPDPNSVASGEIQLIRRIGSGGEVFATSSFTLPPHGQLAQFVSERFGSDAAFGAYVRVRVTSGSISAVALRTVGLLISTIAAN